MEKLKQNLSFGGILNAKDIGMLLGFFKEIRLKPNEHFHAIQTVAKEVAFVEEGILRVYSVDDQGNEITKFFVREGQFAVALDSYYPLQPSDCAYQAVKETVIYTIQKKELDRLHTEIPNLFIFLKSIAENQLLNIIKDNDFLNFGDAKTKYLEFMERYPSLALQVPQQHIASYLKITPQSLSRIRKEI